MDKNQPNNFGPGPMGPAPVGPEPITNQPTPPPVPPVPSVPPAPNPVVPPAPAPMGPDFQPPKPDTGLNKGLIIGLIVAGAVVLAGIGFATGFAIGRSSVKPTNNCPTNDSTTSQSTTSINTNVSKTLNGAWKMTEESQTKMRAIVGELDPESKFYSVMVLTDNTLKQCTDDTMSDCMSYPMTVSQGQAALSANMTMDEIRQQISQSLNKTIDFTENDVYSLKYTQNSSSEGVSLDASVSMGWVMYDNDKGGVSAVLLSLMSAEYDKISD